MNICVLMIMGCWSFYSDTLSFDETRLHFHSRCCEEKLTTFICQYIQSAYVKNETNHELHYILPFDEAKKGGYERLFSALDTSLSELHVASYGIADTNLEEVFLKITAESLPKVNSTGRCSMESLKYVNFWPLISVIHHVRMYICTSVCFVCVCVCLYVCSKGLLLFIFYSRAKRMWTVAAWSEWRFVVACSYRELTRCWVFCIRLWASQIVLCGWYVLLCDWPAMECQSK